MTILQKFYSELTKIRNIRLASRKVSVKSDEVKKRKTQPLVSNEMTKYFTSRKNAQILENFPLKLLRKKKRSPSSIYISDPGTAAALAKHLRKDMSPDMELLEINPGTGLLTQRLLEDGCRRLSVIETLDHFIPFLQKISSNVPGSLTIKTGDFVNVYKLAYQDKQDNGTRVNDLLENLPKRDYKEDPAVRIFAGIGSIVFIKHLINSLVFQTSLYSLGRIEMFLLMPPPLYIHLTCTNEIGYLLYRATTILFQIMFEYKYIAKFPRQHFLPWQFDYNLSKSNKLARVNSVDPDYMYLVRVIPRRNLYDLCPPEDMQGLWYFVKQNCVSRRNRIIPNVEKLIPGCGPRLIINLKQTEDVQQLCVDERKDSLPPYTVPCTTMTNRNFYQDMNIFTQFGDLSPSQMLTLFTSFRTWPEYQDSPFLELLQSSLLKLETSDSDSVDGLEIAEEDDAQIEEHAGLHSEDYIKSKMK